MPRVAIVGAGVSGLSVGVCLGETLPTKDLDLTIFSENFSGCSKISLLSSDAAGGIIRPTDGPSHYGGATNVADTRRWTAVTYDHLRRLRENGVGQENGVNKLPILAAYEGRRSTLPWFATNLHPELRALSPVESAEYGLAPIYQTVWEYNIYHIESSKYLPYLSRRFINQGGLMIQRKISNLKELTRDYDVVINCTGIGARELVGDQSVYPVRGQIVEVQGPNLKAIYMNKEASKKDTSYIIPSYNNRLLLGGTADKDNWSTEVNPEHTESIYRRCIEMCPRLQGAKITGGWAGFRPVRPTVRVEEDTTEESGESLLLHNYGHGGHGFTFSWGCATDIAELVQTNLDLHPSPSSSRAQSKL